MNMQVGRLEHATAGLLHPPCGCLITNLDFQPMKTEINQDRE